MPALIVIPARWGSTRLPGKPLALIAGVPLVERVWRSARAAADRLPACELVVATDDSRIMEAVAGFGGRAVLTDPALANGTARTAAAAAMMAMPPSVVVNMQGDAVFTDPATVMALVAGARATRVPVVTPVVRLDWPALGRLRAHKATTPMSGTSCVRAADGRALWFSKQLLPAMRDEAALRAAGPLSPVWQHLGLYAFAAGTLPRLVALPASGPERLEGLEQLRWLEAGVPVHTIEVAAPAWPQGGIDSPVDVAAAEAAIAAFGEPLARWT